MSVEIRVPDIGDFKDVPIIEVHVKAGDTVAVDDPLLTLESDKATMDIPAPEAGTVGEVLVKVGDRISQGVAILRMQSEGAAAGSPAPRVADDAATTTTEPPNYGSTSGVYDTVEVTVPNIGGGGELPVLTVHVAVGDEVEAEAPLLTLGSEQAPVIVPAPAAGRVQDVQVGVGDQVAEGHAIMLLRTGDQGAAPKPAKAPAAKPAVTGRGDHHAEVVVLGAGPGGYTAAFRAADLGKTVVLVERWPTLGGVCLNVGCIPSKALLHAAKVIDEADEMGHSGVSFGKPSIDLDKLRGWKDGVVRKLTGGLVGLAKQRKVAVVAGTGTFTAPNEISVEGADGAVTTVTFEHAIIAAGSEPVTLPFIPQDDPRVLDSTDALRIDEVPGRLLVVGGGIIGLEMATVYHALGSKVTIVELMDQIIPGADKDIITPLAKRIEKRYANIYLKTKVLKVEPTPEGLVAHFEGPKAPATETFDRVLVAVGRRPNGKRIGAENAGVAVDDRGFIAVDAQMRTNVPHIFAIGDLVGQPMLAHKATHEGKVAAEVAAGRNTHFDAKVIPSVAYTDPEVAWVGVTENECKARGTPYGKGVFPWAANGRSLSVGRDEGLTKVLFDDATGRIIGCGIVGPHAGDLIAEATLAIEMGSDAEDIGLTIHPHPTLSETFGMAAEAFEGTLTDLYMPKKREAATR